MGEVIDDFSEYNYLLVIIFFFFGFLSFYIFIIIKSIENNEETSKFSFYNFINSDEEEFMNSNNVNSKKNVRKGIITVFFIGTILRMLSILGIFLINNKKDLDYVSILNLVLHIIPSYIFIYDYLRYIEYTIKLYAEKKYDLENTNMKNEKLIKKTSFRLIVILLFLLNFVSLICTILFRKTLTTFFYFTSILLSILFLLVSYVYFKEGLYSINSSKFKYNDNNGKLRNKKRIIFISLIIGVSYFLLGTINFLISLGFFKSPYQNWINHNIYDFLWFLIAEFFAVSSIVLKKKKKKPFNKKKSKPQNKNNYFELDGEPISNKKLLKTKSEEKDLNKLGMKNNNEDDDLKFDENGLVSSYEDDEF